MGLVGVRDLDLGDSSRRSRWRGARRPGALALLMVFVLVDWVVEMGVAGKRSQCEVLLI